ncbi:hypothetical protein WME90_43760 [Sorangium sp. So ce375]|uniref:hypothetical protein n=1 Tax=Sorangium sp. So ce375 TaxID=3133306 RepID=UPI003F5B4350
MRRQLRGAGVLLFALAGVQVQGAALAAEPTAADRETARTLLIDGREKLSAGDAKGALQSFQAAHAIMGVPTTGLDLARAQAALGDLVGARATALGVAASTAAPNEPEAFAYAREEAEKLAEELAGRIPSLFIRVTGLPAGASPKVTVDGVVIPPQALGFARKANPGQHSIDVEAPGHAPERRTAELKEREELAVEIQMKPAALPGGPAPGGAGQGADVRLPPGAGEATRPAKDGAGRPAPAWAWISGAVGVASLGAAIGFAVDYATVRGIASSECPEGACDPRRYDEERVADLEARWNRDAGLMIGFGAVGAVAASIAVVGFAFPLAEKANAAPRARESIAVVPWIGGTLGGAVQGTF